MSNAESAPQTQTQNPDIQKSPQELQDNIDISEPSPIDKPGDLPDLAVVGPEEIGTPLVSQIETPPKLREKAARNGKFLLHVAGVVTKDILSAGARATALVAKRGAKATSKTARVSLDVAKKGTEAAGRATNIVKAKASEIADNRKEKRYERKEFIKAVGEVAINLSKGEQVSEAPSPKSFRQRRVAEKLIKKAEKVNDARERRLIHEHIYGKNAQGNVSITKTVAKRLKTRHDLKKQLQNEEIDLIEYREKKKAIKNTFGFKKNMKESIKLRRKHERGLRKLGDESNLDNTEESGEISQDAITKVAPLSQQPTTSSLDVIRSMNDEGLFDDHEEGKKPVKTTEQSGEVSDDTEELSENHIIVIELSATIGTKINAIKKNLGKDFLEKEEKEAEAEKVVDEFLLTEEGIQYIGKKSELLAAIATRGEIALAEKIAKKKEQRAKKAAETASKNNQ